MYVIIVYDVGEKRVGKMLKICRQYLCWIQNSVLEGELSEAKLRELQMKMKAIIDESEDSVIVFTNKMGYNMNNRFLEKKECLQTISYRELSMWFYFVVFGSAKPPKIAL